jgi:hypothetical protein
VGSGRRQPGTAGEPPHLQPRRRFCLYRLHHCQGHDVLHKGQALPWYGQPGAGREHEAAVGRLPAVTPAPLAAELLVGHKDEPVWQPGHVLLHHHLGGGGDGGSEQHPAQHPRVQGRQVLPAVEGAASAGGWRAVAVAEGQRAVLLGGVGAATLRN